MSCPNCYESTLNLHQPLTEPGTFVKGDFEPAKDLTADLTVPPQFPIDRGGFSDLCRGHLRAGNGDSIEVAVKLFRIEDAQDRERLHKRLSHEAKIFGAAQHLLIAEFYGTAVVDTGVGSRPALVLKWYSNGNASQYLAERTTREKLIVIKDMAMALEYLHSQNIVHGDLKGANVLITDTGNAVLTDFGLSYFIDKQTNATTTSNACSARWLSPELAAILLGSHGVSLNVHSRTKESDVWAFGSTAFELVLPRLGLETTAWLCQAGFETIFSQPLQTGFRWLQPRLAAVWRPI